MREFNNKDITALDKLSTEEIRSILESETALELDSNMLLYMLDILENRDALLKPSVDEEEALKSLKENYLTDDIIDVPDVNRDTPKIISIEEIKRRRNKLSVGSRILKPLITAALVIVLMFTLSFGAMAAGIDVFGAIARWTEDLFGFERCDEDAYVGATLGEDKVAPVLARLHEDLMNAGVTEDVLPAYIPEGYTIQEYSSYAMPTNNVFICTLDNNGNKIFLSYIVYSSDIGENGKYHKNVGNPEELVINGLTHYIIDNDGETVIVWMNGNVEGSISGMVSEDVLLEILYSVYEE